MNKKRNKIKQDKTNLTDALDAAKYSPICFQLGARIKKNRC